MHFMNGMHIYTLRMHTDSCPVLILSKQLYLLTAGTSSTRAEFAEIFGKSGNDLLYIENSMKMYKPFVFAVTKPYPILLTLT